jgi:hypothetical protein
MFTVPAKVPWSAFVLLVMLIWKFSVASSKLSAKRVTGIKVELSPAGICNVPDAAV